jgi:hypothetical protein
VLAKANFQKVGYRTESQLTQKKAKTTDKILPHFFLQFARHGRKGYQGQKPSLFISTGKYWIGTKEWCQ